MDKGGQMVGVGLLVLALKVSVELQGAQEPSAGWQGFRRKL